MADENKVVSISFNNKQFMEDVEDTIDAVRRLNDATSGKHAINVSGFREINSELENLTKNLEETVNISSDSFSNIGKAAYNSVADVNNLKTSTDSLSTSFNSLQVIALGALWKIGETVATTSMQISNALVNTLTRGIRDGWQEYNILIDSTQTISTNVQRFGSDLDDVTDALDRLNDYADLTIYNFGQMTRNIGYFTAAGSNLEDSVVAVQGLMNVAAFFGVQNEQAQRAAYQMSQFMARGTMNLMDWRSMVNAGMGGDALKRELVTIGATIGGYSQEWADEVMANFEDSLREGWLTSDIFLEAMARFQGSRDRAYYESIFDEEGNRVYEEDEIKRLLNLGNSALEAAQKVRTFKQMMDAVGESIGSGWGRIFRTIIGDLEEAKEFWSPINDLITGVIGKTMDYIAGIAEGWAKFGRSTMIQDMMYGLEGISKVLGVLGQAFENVFGSTGSISGDLLRLTIHIGDFVEAMALTDEEAEDLRDIFEALLMPFGLLIDLIKSLTLWLFDGGDAMEQVYRNTSDTYNGIVEFRKALLWVVGSIARVVKRIGEFVRQIKIIPKAVNVIGSIIKKVFSGVSAIITAPFIALYNVWEKYNITDKLLVFAQNMYNRFVEPIKNGILELVSIFDTFKTRVSRVFSALNIDGFTVLSDALSILKQLFSDILDPTVSFQEAFDNFTESIGNSSVGTVIDVIRQSLSDLWASIRTSTIGEWFENAGSRIQIFWDTVRNSSIGDFIQNLADRLSELTGIDSSTIYHVFEEIKNGISLVGDVLLGSAFGVGDFISNLASVVRSFFETEDEMADPNGGALVSGIEALNDAVRGTDSRKFAQLAEDAKAVANAFGGDTKGERITTPWIVTFLSDLSDRASQLREELENSELIQGIRNIFGWIAAPFQVLFRDQEEWSAQAIAFNDELTRIKNMVTDTIQMVRDFFSGDIDFGFTFTNPISVFINSFNDIDDDALRKANSVGGLIIAFMSNLTAIFVGKGFMDFLSSIKTTSKAALEAAKGAKLQALASVLTSFALLLLVVFAAIALVVSAIKNELVTPLEIVIATGIISLVLIAVSGILLIFVTLATKISGNANKATSVMKSAAKALNSVAFVILSIGAVIGLIVAAAYLISSMGSEYQQDRMINIIGLLGAIATVLSLLMIVFIASMAKISKHIGDSAKSLATLSKMVSAINGVVFAISTILLAMVAAAYVISKIPDDKAFSVFVELAVILVYMTTVIAVLMAVATGFSEKMSKLDAKKVAAATSMAVVGLLGIIVAVGAIFLLSAATEKYLSTLDIYGYLRLALALGMVVGIIGLLMAAVHLLLTRIDTLANTLVNNTTNAIKLVREIFVDLGALLGTMALMIGVIGAVALVIAHSDHPLLAAFAVLAMTAAIYVIAKSLEKLMLAMSQIKDINKSQIIAPILLLISLVGSIFALAGALALISNIISNTSNIIQASTILAMITASVIAIGAIIYKLVSTTPKINPAQVWSLIGSFAITMIGIGTMVASLYFLSTIQEQRLTKATNSLFKLMITVSVAFAIFAVIAQLGGNAPALLAAGGGFAISCLGLLVLAQAIAQLANIDVGKLEEARLTMLSMALVVTAIMAVMAIISGTGYGAAAIGLAAAAMLSMAASVFIMSGAIEITATGVDKLATALDRLSHIDMRPLALNFIALIQTIPMIFEALKSVSPSIIGIVGLVMDVVAAIITAQIGIIGKVIMNEIDAWLNYIESKVGQIYRIMNLLMYGNGSNGGLIHMILQGTYTLFFDESYGVLKMIDEFVLAVIEMIPGWIKAIIDVVANEFSSDESQHTIGNALGRLLENIQAWVFEKMGVDSWEDVGLSIMKKILLGAMNGVEQGIEWILENAPEALGGMSMWIDLASRPDMSDQYYESGVSDSEAYVEGLRSGYSSMDSYYANMYSQQETRARSMADVISDVFSNLGGSGGGIGSAIQNGISSILGSFGVDTSGGILSGVVGSIGNALGIDLSGGLGGLLGNVFGGFNMGSMFGGVDTSTLTAAGDMFGNASTLDPNSLNAFTGAVSSVGDAWSDGDVTSPVITPTVDTSQVSLGINDIENMFANAEIDTIAVDASGSFMTGSYGGSTDQATNGMSVINFTQYNTSPRDLSRIEIYRDTQNAIRSVT